MKLRTLYVFVLVQVVNISSFFSMNGFCSFKRPFKIEIIHILFLNLNFINITCVMLILPCDDLSNLFLIRFFSGIFTHLIGIS